MTKFSFLTAWQIQIFGMYSENENVAVLNLCKCKAQR